MMGKLFPGENRGHSWQGQRGGAPEPEMPTAAGWIILDSLLWCQLKMFESQIWIPDEGLCCSLPAATQSWCHQQGMALFAHLAAASCPGLYEHILLHDFPPLVDQYCDHHCFMGCDYKPFCSQPFFLTHFKLLFLCFFIAIDNNQTSSTPTFHCNPAVLKQTHLNLYLQTLLSVTLLYKDLSQWQLMLSCVHPVTQQPLGLTAKLIQMTWQN